MTAAIVWLLFLSMQLLALSAAPAAAAPKAEPWSFWAANNPAGKVRVDHAPWDRFLKKYVVTNHLSGINRVRYASVTPDDRNALDAYVFRLQGVEVTRLPRSGQKAYWINLYNALTVKVVLDHYHRYLPRAVQRRPMGSEVADDPGAEGEPGRH